MRWLDKIAAAENGCWVYTGTIGRNGYSYYNDKLVHRLSFEHFRRPIPEGLTIDHLCRVRRCINPDHMEVVTRGENARRGDHSKPRLTECKRGHRDFRVRPDGDRWCAPCARENARARSDRHGNS